MSDSVPKAVFLSKKEREERAIARLQERRNKERLALQESERKKENFLRRKADEVVNEKVAVESSDLEKEKERELTQIKEQYLGKRKRDKKSRKGLSGQRSKFRFEWDEDEDTAGGDLNPLYSQKLEPALAFGRGALGGIDKDEEIRSLKSETKSQMFSRGKFARDKSAVHWSEKTLAQMTERDWRIFSEDFNISVRGGNAIKPMRYWNEIEFPDEILRAVEEAGYKEPTPIQRQAIPLGLDRKDMIAIAQTGSGKTAAFVLPMLMYVLQQPAITEMNASDGPYAVILAPTRELAQQIHRETLKLSKYLSRVRCVTFVGGTSAEAQGFLLRDGVEIVIATPGRLIANLKQRYIVLNQCRYLVLDEADRMMNMGFEEQVTEIIEAMPPQSDRLTFMFSATMPIKVESLVRNHLNDPVYVAIGDRHGSIVDRIDQRFEFLTSGAKESKLVEVLNEEEPPIIVFCSSRKRCEIIARALSSYGFSVITLHSDKNQQQREAALSGFKEGRYDILVATDLAGRGLDIEGVTHVVNFDMPKNLEMYTHRIGRTGRAGKKGIATSLVTSEDQEILEELQQGGIEVPSNSMFPNSSKPQMLLY